MFSFQYRDLDFAHKEGFLDFPNDEYGRHMHYTYEMLFFIKGDCKYTVEDEQRTLSNYDIVFIKPGSYHFASPKRDVTYERYVLKFSDNILPPEVLEKMANITSFHPNCVEFEKLFKQFDLYNEQKYFDKNDLYYLFSSKLIEIIVNLSKIDNSKFVTNDPMISSIITFIESHIKEHLTLDMISRNLNYSTSYIAKEFKRKMHSSIMSYIRSKKIILARTQIIYGENPTKVAEEYGFDDYTTFYRTYIKLIGTPPSKDKNH
ncbi:MAG: helix-turn-helix transcriptional regulator [Bacilli bacterium]|nr:helix-turn-helix transcriptional regulator [Bacilli bacterium]